MKKITILAFVMIMLLVIGVSAENLFIQQGLDGEIITEQVTMDHLNESNELLYEQETQVAEADLSAEALHDNSGNKINSAEESVYTIANTYGTEDGRYGITAPKRFIFPILV